MLNEEELETRFAYRRLMIIANKIKTLIQYLPEFKNYCIDSIYEENEIVSKTRLYLKKFIYSNLDIKEINVGISNIVYLELKLNRANYFTYYDGKYKFEVTPINGNSVKAIKDELNEFEKELCRRIKMNKEYMEEVNKTVIMREIIGEK